MAATPTSSAADVAKLAPGTTVEVKGTIRCAKPMTGSFSQQLCVYAKSEIERKEVRWRDGKREEHYVTESSEEHHVPFYVEDASGSILVQPQDASFEAVQVYNQSGNSAVESLVSIGMSLAGAGSQDRRYKESILAPDIPVYVLGTVIAGGAVGAAPKDAVVKDFIITHRSEEARTRSSNITAIVLVVIAVALAAGAVWALWAAVKYP
jgi:hypothetical protein